MIFTPQHTARIKSIRFLAKLKGQSTGKSLTVSYTVNEAGDDLKIAGYSFITRIRMRR